MDTIKEKLRKVYQLAQKGADGERENAQRALDALLKKYGLDITDISDEERTAVRIKYTKTIHKRLLRQIVAAVLQQNNVTSYIYTYGKAIGFDLTKAEEVEVRFLFKEYKRIWEDEQNDVFTAFCMKHQLLAPSTGSEEEWTDEQWARYFRLQGMAGNMKDAQLKRKRIGGAE